MLDLSIPFRPTPKSQCAHEWALDSVSGADFRAGSVPEASGARRGPGEPKIDRKIHGRIYRCIFPKVCPDRQTDTLRGSQVRSLEHTSSLYTCNRSNDLVVVVKPPGSREASRRTRQTAPIGVPRSMRFWHDNNTYFGRCRQDPNAPRPTI